MYSTTGKSAIIENIYLGKVSEQPILWFEIQTFKRMFFISSYITSKKKKKKITEMEMQQNIIYFFWLM